MGGVEVHLRKSQRRFDTKLVRMLVQPPLQIRIGGRRSSGRVLGQKLKLLPHAPADDGVVFVKSHRQRLAVEHLLPDGIFD